MALENIEQFDPKNQQTATDETNAKLAELTDDELKELAEKYPNGSDPNTYLVLKDSSKPDNGQLFPRSTFANLYDLRVKYKMKNLSAISFVSKFDAVKTQAAGSQAQPQQGSTQDLTEDEKIAAAGLKGGEVGGEVVGGSQTGKEVGAGTETGTQTGTETGTVGAPGLVNDPTVQTGQLVDGQIASQTGVTGSNDAEGESFPDLSSEAAAAADGGGSTGTTTNAPETAAPPKKGAGKK